MATRRSHQKSRSGCSTCKLRHVKCDEKGPPCGSCKARGTVCEYPTPLPNASDTRPPVVQEATTSELGSMWHLNGPKYPTTKRLLELQLMSRWCSTTYRSCVTEVAEDDVVWQSKIPEWSIHYDFLLDGIFALTAYEIASSSGQSQYVNVAEEYQGRALTSFRRQLTQMDDESLEPTLCFSMMLMVLALASAQFVPALPHPENDIMLQKTLAHFQLVRGCSIVVQNKEEWIKKNPYVNRLMLFDELPRSPLEPRVEAALSKLSAANESRIEASMHKSYEERKLEVSYWKACKSAIEQLRECYARCEDKRYQGYILGWLNLAGDDYIEALKACDEMALLVLMFWGVLAEKLSYLAWWAKSFGRLLVEEVSNRYRHDDASALSKELISTAAELCQAFGPSSRVDNE